jgi:hypothetical protein
MSWAMPIQPSATILIFITFKTATTIYWVFPLLSSAIICILLSCILFWTSAKTELCENTKTSLQLYTMRKKRYWPPKKRFKTQSSDRMICYAMSENDWSYVILWNLNWT